MNSGELPYTGRDRRDRENLWRSSRTVQLDGKLILKIWRLPARFYWLLSTRISSLATRSLRTDLTMFIRWSLRWTLFSSMCCIHFFSNLSTLWRKILSEVLWNERQWAVIRNRADLVRTYRPTHIYCDVVWNSQIDWPLFPFVITCLAPSKLRYLIQIPDN